MSGNIATEIPRASVSMPMNVATIGYIVAALAVIYLLRNKYAQGLNAVPGPFLAGFSSLWRLVDVWGGSAHWTIVRLHRELGPLVRTGPKHVSVSDPEAINTIYGVKPRFLKVRSLNLMAVADLILRLQTGFYPQQSISWNKKPEANL